MKPSKLSRNSGSRKDIALSKSRFLMASATSFVWKKVKYDSGRRRNLGYHFDRLHKWHTAYPIFLHTNHI
jgi:hypothetical protein